MRHELLQEADEVETIDYLMGVHYNEPNGKSIGWQEFHYKANFEVFFGKILRFFKNMDARKEICVVYDSFGKLVSTGIIDADVTFTLSGGQYTTFADVKTNLNYTVYEYAKSGWWCINGKSGSEKVTIASDGTLTVVSDGTTTATGDVTMMVVRSKTFDELPKVEAANASR